MGAYTEKPFVCITYTREHTSRVIKNGEVGAYTEMGAHYICYTAIGLRLLVAWSPQLAMVAMEVLPVSFYWA